MQEYSFEKSYAMLEKAKQWIPNGIYGPRTPAFLTYGSYPCFLTRGKGSHIWDVDGNEYIDYMCSFGTNIIGLCNEEVDAAAIEQMKNGDCFTLPSNRWNELAEAMVNQIKGQDWVVFAKNGSDVTTYATTIARAYTGKNKIILAEGAYHGSHYWCTHSSFGIPAEYNAHILYFHYNDMEELKRIIADNSGQIAGIMLTPHHHPATADQLMPAPGFYQELREICDREGMLMMIDDIRCGFRLHENGSHCFYNADPDLICFGKAMANGYPISAMTGKELYKATAQGAFFTGTHYFSGVPMAAALTTLKVIVRDGVVDYVNQIGLELKQGMEQQALAAGLKISYTGPPAIPYMRFVEDQDFSVNRFFCGEAAKRGIFFHPHHNWFISGAHTREDIEKTLQVTEECFALTKKAFFE